MPAEIPTTEELRRIVREETMKILEEAMRMHENKRTFITREEVADRLSISISSVHAWTKKGILKKYRAGNHQVRYRLDEVLEVLKKVKSNNKNL